MDKFPELQQILGRGRSNESRVIWVIIIFILAVIVVIVFLIATGYIQINSPTNTLAK